MSRRRTSNKGPQAGTEPITANVNLSDADDVVCDGCGGFTFLPVILMKRLSAIMSPTGQEVIIPMQMGYSCRSCGWINKEFLPSKEEESDEQRQEQSTPKIIV